MNAATVMTGTALPDTTIEVAATENIEPIGIATRTEAVEADVGTIGGIEIDMTVVATMMTEEDTVLRVMMIVEGTIVVMMTFLLVQEMMVLPRETDAVGVEVAVEDEDEMELQNAGLPLLKIRYPSRKESARPLVGMFMPQVMSNIPQCRLNKLVCVSLFPLHC